MILRAKFRFFIVLLILGVVGARWTSVAISQESASAPPGETALDLPEGVSLQQLAERKKLTCTFVGNKVVKKVDGPKFIAPVELVMPQLMKLRPDSLDRMAAAPDAKQCVKSLCTFLKKANCPNDLAEAVIRANCKEKLYRNKDLIDAAAPHCNPQRVAAWRQKYQNQ